MKTVEEVKQQIKSAADIITTVAKENVKDGTPLYDDFNEVAIAICKLAYKYGKSHNPGGVRSD